jgi:hypothetical protein
MVAAARGYKCIICMPQVPAMYERYIIDRKFGAEVHLTSVNQNDMGGTLNNLLNYAKDVRSAHTWVVLSHTTTGASWGATQSGRALLLCGRWWQLTPTPTGRPCNLRTRTTLWWGSVSRRTSLLARAL